MTEQRGRTMQQGFTLIEVLVALVVSALLLGMIGSTIAAAGARQQIDRAKSSALLAAEAALTQRLDAPFSDGAVVTTSGALRLSVSERIVAHDPRQQMLLSEISVTVDRDNGPPTRLLRRVIKAAPQP
jgi:prepilin-type N-terminal cleavage/methylation domain-containing protein